MKPFFDIITHTAPCADPSLPSNGKRDSSNFGHDKTVIFQCNDNYTLVGNERMSCNDGVWSAELPQCKGKSQSKNSKVFERKRPIQGELFCMLGKGLTLLLTQRRVPTLVYPLMGNETVPILAMTRQSYSSAMTTTLWWEMKE